MIRLLKRLLPRRVAARLHAALTDRLRARHATGLLVGSGLEIGAMHRPLRVPPGVTVHYVDRLTREAALRAFQDLDADRIVTPDIVDDGFLLESIPATSQGFVIAGHVLEHAPDPVGVMERWWDVLIDGGVLFLIVPRYDRTFDRGRALTSLEHLLDDHAIARRDGVAALAARDFDHYLEWVAIAEPRMDGRTALSDRTFAAARARELASARTEIHFHTFSSRSFAALVARFAQRPSTPSNVLKVVELRDEVLAVLRKTPADATFRG